MAVSIIDIILSNKIGSTKEIKHIKDSRKGFTATILANGPSAKEIINGRRNLLSGTDMLVVNDFVTTEVFFELKPKYYLLLDPAYFNPGAKVESEQALPDNNATISRIVDNLRMVDWELCLFIPSTHMSSVVKTLYGVNSNIKVIPFNATRILGFFWFENLMYDRGYGIPTSRNVIIPAMVLMILLGYKTIYLYGCEFSWTKTMDVDPENGMMFFNDRHFYSKDEIRYFGKGGYVWWLETIAEELRGTEHVARYAEHKGVRIINRTKGSFIDAFDYENPDDIKTSVE